MKYIIKLTFLFLFINGISQSNLSYSKRIDSLVLARYNKGQFNGSLLVQKEGEIIYKRSLGWADVENKDTLSIDDPMRIASITKTFTAVCILKLVQEGKVDLDEDINTYLPEIDKSGITIHHLLSHTSGICYINGGPHFRKMKKYQKERGDRRWTNDDVLKYFQEFKPESRKEVGEEYRYSNISFSILASLIERLSGDNYGDYLKKNIFNPLTMKNSLLYLPKKNNDSSEKVLSYRPNGKCYKHIPVYYKYKKSGELKFSDDIYGDKYIMSTVEDMSKFNDALLGGEIINKSLLKKMFTPVLLNSGKAYHNNYGYGISQNDWSDSLYYQHGGYLAAFETINLFNTKGTQIVILSNIENGEYYALYESVLDILESKVMLKNYKNKNDLMTKKKEKFLPVFEGEYKINYHPLYE